MDWRDNLYSPHKLAYVKDGENKLDGECILCAVAGGDDRIPDLTIAESELLLVTLNLYPYNPGHLMIFPRRHIEDIRDYTEAEWAEIRKLQNITMAVLDEAYSPQGYNVGYNVGRSSGASIPHLHQHIVPRYRSEMGVIDILSGSRILVEDPSQTRQRLLQLFERYYESGDMDRR
ncbi:MAG: HIT domain-containing protein [bacterium]|nr:HIT domain-containing protein [bacterium]